MIKLEKIYLWFYEALIGEIYPEIRAIAVRFDKNNDLKVIMYLDRKPTEYDSESLDVILTEVLANTTSYDKVNRVDASCVYSEALLKDLDCLDRLVYARREYDA